MSNFNQSKWKSLTRQLRGEAIWPGEPAYEEAYKGYNALHDARPGLILRPDDVAEVARIVRSVAETGAPFAVRGGGHSLAGFSSTEGGILILLSKLRTIDLAARTARAGAGLTAGELTTALSRESKVVPFGDSPSVGISGITLGGGIGWLSRKIGLTIDSVIGAEVVTADGTVLEVDAGNHPDLFWALRGGGGNFGVVTRFDYAVHDIGPVLGGIMMLPLSAATIRSVIDTAAVAPNELGVIALAMRAPPGMPGFPEERIGEPVLMMSLVWSGEPKQGEAVIERLRACADRVLSDGIRSMRYEEMYELFAAAPRRITNTTCSLLADVLDDAALNDIMDAVDAGPPGDALAAVEIRVLGGAIASVPDLATAYAHRQRKLLVSAVCAGFEAEALQTNRKWVAALDGRLRRHALGAYVNFIETPDPDSFKQAYPPPVAHRLVAIKQRYDPANLFRRNLNILAR
jgi:FAD/FMN-containing dehydrogenase